MKSILMFFFVILFNNVFGQTHVIEDCWVPEKYVKAMMNRDPAADKYLYPVSAIITPFKQCTLIAYKSDPHPVKTRKIVVGKPKYEIPYIKYVFNLMEVADTTVNRFAKGKTYLFMEGNRLVLELIGNGYNEKTYFIDSVDGYKFNSYYDVGDYLQKKYRKQ